jgi:hypothetical protein
MLSKVIDAPFLLIFPLFVNSFPSFHRGGLGLCRFLRRYRDSSCWLDM